MYSTEEGVTSVLPFNMKRPDEVRIDGEQGVTRPTYDLLLDSVETEITVRLDSAGVTASMRRHKLITQAADRLMAAQIARKMKTFQDLANSLFAEANVKLRLFFDGVHGTSEGREKLAAPLVILGDTTLLTDNDFAGSRSGLNIFR